MFIIYYPDGIIDLHKELVSIINKDAILFKTNNIRSSIFYERLYKCHSKENRIRNKYF